MYEEDLKPAVTHWATETLEEWLPGWKRNQRNGHEYRVTHLGNGHFRVEKDTPDRAAKKFVVTVAVTDVL